MNTLSRPNDVSRREFLVRGMAGAGLLSAGVPARSAGRGDNPFAYDVERFRKTDPKLVAYEPVRQFRTQRPCPRRIALGPDDRLYVTAERHVTVFDVQGNRLSETAYPASPRCVAWAEPDTMFVVFKDHVEIYGAKGERRAQWTPPEGRPFLSGIALAKDAVFVADSGNRVVWRYDRSGKLLKRLGKRDASRGVPGFVAPSAYLDVQIAPDGLLRVNNHGRHRVEAYTFDGDLELSWGRPSAGITGFCGCCNPVNFAVLADGRCVTFEKGLPRVKIYSSDGAFECVVAGPELFAEPAQAHRRADLDDCTLGGLDGVVDSQGHIHVLDLLNGQVHVMRRKADAACPAPVPNAS